MVRQYLSKKKNPLIVICSEGANNTTEKIYFSNFRKRNLRIQFATGGSTDPEGMLNDLLNYIRKEDLEHEEDCSIYIVIDTDLSEERIKRIEKILSKIELLKKYKIEVITSSPTFEIWYLMHYRNSRLSFASSKEVKKVLQDITGGKYYETMDIYPYIKDKQDDAYKRAKKIIDESIKCHENAIRINPHTYVYKIIDTIDNKKI